MCQRGQSRCPAADGGIPAAGSPAGATVTWVLVGLNILGYLTEWVYPRVVNYFDMIGAAYDPTINQTVGVAHDRGTGCSRRRSCMSPG